MAVKREVEKLGTALREEITAGLQKDRNTLGGLSDEVTRIQVRATHTICRARRADIQVERALEGRDIVLIGAYCYINGRVMGQKSTTIDEVSSHVSRSTSAGGEQS